MNRFAKVLAVLAALTISGLVSAFAYKASPSESDYELSESAVTCPPLNYLNYAKQEKLGRRLDAQDFARIKIDGMALFYSLRDNISAYCIDPGVYNQNVLDLQRMQQLQPMAFENLHFAYDMDMYNRQMRIEFTVETGIMLLAEIEGSDFKIPTEKIMGQNIPRSSFTLDGSVKMESLNPQLLADLARFGFDLSKVKVNIGQDPRRIDSIEIKNASEDQINTFKVAEYLRSQKYLGVYITEKSRVSSIFAGYTPIYPACVGCGPDPVFRITTPTGNRRYVIQNNGTHYFEVSDTNATQVHTPTLSTLSDLKQWYPEAEALKIARQRNK